MSVRTKPAAAMRGSSPAVNGTVGVVGMGLMGVSIAASLLLARHRVVAVEHKASLRQMSRKRVLALLKDASARAFSVDSPQQLIQQFSVHSELSPLKDSQVVIESITESLSRKRQVIRRIEKVVSSKTIIGSNTSGIPVTSLQQFATHPGRVLGLHWGEPAHVSRFMEVIPGKHTSSAAMRLALDLARSWGKDPTLVRKDVPGFVTNRIMYAILREACHLVDTGVATIQDVDRSIRNDMGYWISIAGPFRFMDLTGVPAVRGCHEVSTP